MRQSNQQEIDRVVAEHAAEKAQAAFFQTASMRSETTETAKILSRAQSYSKHLWQWENLDEDEFNAKLITFCKELCGGNELMGLLLASAAEWPGDAS